MVDDYIEKQRHDAAKKYGQNFTKEPWDPEPKNDKTWYKMSHCGPGSLDGTEECECGLSQEECARKNMASMFENFTQVCGCSGFFCYKCGVFYAQDACWETYGEEYHTVNNQYVILKDDGYLYCLCGAKLFKEPEAID